MPVDGGCSQEYDLYNQQLFCELKDSVDTRWSGDWSGCHQKRHLSRRLFVTLVVYSSHVWWPRIATAKTTRSDQAL